MSHDEFVELFREALFEEVASHPSDEELKEFMSGPADTSPDMLERMRKEFVEKILQRLRPEPARHAGSEMTFGRWIEQARKEARLTQGFIATALGEPPSFVERLEKGQTLPWTIPAPRGSDIAILFRIHFNAFSELIANSHKGLASQSSQIPEANCPSGKAPAISPRSSQHDEDISGEIKGWLEAVRRDLEEKHAKHLLD
jgi:transcriptional regulator with XRE-family HTH domain